MADLRPAYYDAFQCIADQCKIDCCTGWDICFNRKDYLKIRQQKGSDILNSAIKDALTRIKSKHPYFYADFRLKENGCPLLTENKLCRLQAECGYDALPEVCKTFPRQKVYAPSGYYEYSLSPACEAVLELLWKLPEGIDFVSDPLPKAEHIMRTALTENLKLSSYFQEIRSLCIDLLQDRRFSLRERILLMGIFLQKLTVEDADVPAWIQQTEQMLRHSELATMVSPLFVSITEEQQKLVQMQHIKVLIRMQNESIYRKEQEHKDLYAFREMVLNQMIEGGPPLISNEVTAETISPEEQKIICLHTQKFKETTARFSASFAQREYFFENLMVSIFFQQRFPYCNSTEVLWKSYVSFCNIYSLFRFMAICSYLKPAETEEAAKNGLFQGLLCISRGILHNTHRESLLTKDFFAYENDSLAHMAMLLSL